MNAIAAVALLLLCSYLATTFATRWKASGSVTRALARFVLFGIFFFCPFFLLGVFNLLTGLPAVQVPLAAALNAATSMAVFIARRRGPVQSSEKVQTSAEFRRGARAFWLSLDKTARLLLVATGVTFALLAVLVCAEYPRGYEPRSYHLPIAAHIFQSRGLSVWDREYMDTLPANASLYYGVLLNLLPEHLVSASNVLFLAPLMLALYALGRRTGADPSASAVAACGVATIPIVAFSALEAGADVGGIAFLAAAVYFVIAGDARSTRDSWLAGLAAGLAFGFKTVHLVSIGFLLVVILVRRWRGSADPLHRGRLGNSIVGGATFSAGILLTSGVWLVRNWLELGNPVYPVYLGRLSEALGWTRALDVDYFGRRALQFEWVRSPREWLVYPWVEWHARQENFKHSSGLGAFFAALVPPALVASLLGLWSERSRGREATALLFAGGGGLALVWWFAGDRQPRYLMGALVYWIPLVAAMFSLAVGRARRTLAWIACAACAFMLAVVVSVQGFEFAYRFVLLHQRTRHEFYGYPEVVDSLPPGSTIVNVVSRTENWGLFGAAQTNRVINSRRVLRTVGAPFGDAPPSAVALSASVLERFGATYVLALSGTKLVLGPGISLTEVGRADWPETRPVLYRVAISTTERSWAPSRKMGLATP